MESEIAIGIISSIVAEILKFVPLLRYNELTTALTVIAVNSVGAYFFTFGDWSSFFFVFGSSMLTYKGFVKPVAKTAGLVTQ